MRAPEGLGPRGRALWRSIAAAVAQAGDEEHVAELDERERELLRLACAQADDIAALEREIRRAGVVVEGSKGQPRLSPLLAEARQARLALARLLGDLSLPDLEEKPRTQASLRAQHAANVRWDLEARRRQRAS